MSTSEPRVRRATVDDLAALRAIWAAMHFPDVELERRLTEFQVVESPGGELSCALGLEIAGRQGILHSEAFADFSQADALRPLLWKRVQTLVMNHGVARLWTKESAPFWRQSGFVPAEEPLVKKLPPAWAAEASGWLTLQIHDEEVLEKKVDLEFARLRQEEKKQLDRMMRPVRMLKIGAMVLAIILAIAVIVFSIQLLLSQLGPAQR